MDQGYRSLFIVLSTWGLFAFCYGLYRTIEDYYNMK
jgi:hypothetical protein